MAINKSEKRELDRLLREACFARDSHKCQKCSRTDTLAPAHIHPKGRYRKMRWDIRNVITLCYSCHIHWAHQDPLGFTEWIHEVLSKDRLQALKLRSQANDGSVMDYNLIRLDLEQEAKKYE